ncbi:MAG: SDR family NAD(P)-dependent oxidoreductase [Candidatus Latescibacterota bacterium]
MHESDRVRLRPLDVTDDDERVAVVDEALRDWEGVDILVNNAGIAYRAVVSCTWMPATPSAPAPGS